MKEWVKRIYKFLARPITEEFHLMVILAILVIAPLFIGRIIVTNSIILAIWDSLHCIVLCYVLVLFFTIIPYFKRRLWRIFLYVLGFIDFVIEIICWTIVRGHFSSDMVAILLETNINESKEFFETYFSFNILLLCILAIILIVIVIRLSSLLNCLGRKIAFPCLLGVLLISAYLLLNKSQSWCPKFYTKIWTVLAYETPPNLKDYKKNITLSIEGELPDNVLLIIGESFSKSHSSLYEYSKNTNPCLSKLVADSVLYVYDNAISAATSTIPNIKSILSSYKQEYGDEIKWYECTTIPQIFSSAGYKTFWLSNQSPTGMYDNVAASYANLCDSIVWVGSMVKGAMKTDKDEALIGVLGNLKLTDKNFIIMHLMGSHCTYESRYPEEWSLFTADDYMYLPEHQRKVVSTYDNSILYNDWVVSEILSAFSDKETIALYLSDHGLDMFESSYDYFGYAKSNNEASIRAAKAVPFLVYSSPIAKMSCIDIVQNISDRKGLNICTEDTIEFIMNILNISILDEEQ